MQTISKALAYITREKSGQLELLIFEHVDFPEAGLQVPAGTIDHGESPEVAVLREVLEESGLTEFIYIQKLGVFEYEAKYKNEHHSRHVFWLQSSENKR